MLIENIKVLTGADDSKDSLINIYIDRAVATINNYLNNENYDKEYIKNEFKEAIIFLVENAYNNKGKEHIKSESQGRRSITYKDDLSFAITSDVEDLLPAPFMKMR